MPTHKNKTCTEGKKRYSGVGGKKKVKIDLKDIGERKKKQKKKRKRIVSPVKERDKLMME